MTPTIKFSNDYHKLAGVANGSLCYLIEALEVNLEDLSPEFLSYDTGYWGGHYKLPKKGKYLLLFFLNIKGVDILYTTLRRWTPKKAEYYKKNIGEVFVTEIDRGGGK